MKWYSDLALENEYLIGIRGYRPMLLSIFSARRAEKFGCNEQNKRFLRELLAGKISHFTSRIYSSLIETLF